MIAFEIGVDKSGSKYRVFCKDDKGPNAVTCTAENTRLVTIAAGNFIVPSTSLGIMCVERTVVDD